MMSDWGAVNNRVPDLKAGLDLEMPSSQGVNDKLIVQAVKEGSLDESVVNKAVERILNIVYRFEENRDKEAVFDRDKDHEAAAKIAKETIVLLKNEESILPLPEDKKIVFIGEFAVKPRYQGGGSSHINSHKITSALDAAQNNANVVFSMGYTTDTDELEEDLLAQAVKEAGEADVAVIFAGLPDSYESEGYDRVHMSMPEKQNKLIEAVAKVQPNVVVVLHNGSPIEMPWLSQVKGVLEAYLSGQAVGLAEYDILFGKVNPSAKLPESFPIKLEDNPSYLNFPGVKDDVEYNEGIFVGYRYYDKKKMDVLFPFGYGLSYTTFAYSNLKLSSDCIKDDEPLTVTVDVTNTGAVAGKEIVQLYVADKESTVMRPVKELRDFAKVDLQPGETKTVEFVLGKRAFAYYNTEIDDWHVESGEFTIMIGKSSREIVESGDVYVESTVNLPIYYTTDSTIGDLTGDPVAAEFMRGITENNVLTGSGEDQGSSAPGMSLEMMEALFRDMPVRSLLSFAAQEGMDMAKLQRMIDQINHLNLK